MPTNVHSSGIFIKRLRELHRKYPSVKSAVTDLVDELAADSRPGDKIPNVGYDVYKVRLANKSAQRGKRGGFRVIYYALVADEVLLLTIYSKFDQADVPLEVLRAIIDDHPIDGR